MKGLVGKIFPFLSWFEGFSGARLRADLIAGLTVALVLIPQSMAYAQLAGLPAYYGLYAAFLPPIVAALFGSSHQLATGPVAVVSLMTSTALGPLATAGSDAYIGYAILLALLVGAFQFSLGALKLGLVVNFLSHPVVNGFTNAAAIIIATSQLSKLFGVDVDAAEHHYETIYRVINSALHYTHLPTLAMGAFSFALMTVLKRINPKIPNVLVAVVVTTAVSAAAGFEKKSEISLADIKEPAVARAVDEYNHTLAGIEEKSEERVELTNRLENAVKDYGSKSVKAQRVRDEITIANIEIEESKEEVFKLRSDLRHEKFSGVKCGAAGGGYYRRGGEPAGCEADGRVWRLKVGNRPIEKGAVKLSCGGAVVGNIPGGLPAFSLPKLDLKSVAALFPMAMIISLLGFMEAISIAKAMAAKTGQRIDPNQELMGQGLANMLGSLGRGYAVSGSFSRSAVNLQAGAQTGLANVISGSVVVVALLFFTKYLYHLPQAVLASIIMMAVIGLVNVKGFVHSWQAQKYDGAISVITFIATLAFAPHLDKGIMIGVGLSLGHYLFRNMRPDVHILAKHPDGSFRDAATHGLKQCDHLAVIRFNGSLIFVNVSFLESAILEETSSMPHLKHILIVGNGINEVDASGEELLSLLVSRMREAGYDISFSGLNESVLAVMKRTHLLEKIGEDHLYRSVTAAMEALHAPTHAGSHEEQCPLAEVVYPAAVDEEAKERMLNRWQAMRRRSGKDEKDGNED